jgi:hypothetical protein
MQPSFFALVPVAVSLALLPALAFGQDRAMIQPRAIATSKAVASIVAINGNSVTLRASDGRTQVVTLKSAAGLRVGQPTSWCEEDCRVLSAWVELPVQGVRAGPR